MVVSATATSNRCTIEPPQAASALNARSSNDEETRSHVYGRSALSCLILTDRLLEAIKLHRGDAKAQGSCSRSPRGTAALRFY
jgi:hypothetical protein